MSLSRFSSLGYGSLLWLAALSGGCGGNDVKSVSVDAGADAAPVDEEDDESEVPCFPDTPVFQPGLSAGDGGIVARVVSGNPESPRQYENSWVLDFVDPQGNAIEDITIDDANTYMPVHGHGGGRTPKATNLSEPGRVQLDILNFTMAGPWQVNIDASSVRVGKATIQFDVCVGR